MGLGCRTLQVRHVRIIGWLVRNSGGQLNNNNAGYNKQDTVTSPNITRSKVIKGLVTPASLLTTAGCICGRSITWPRLNKRALVTGHVPKHAHAQT